MPLLNITFWFLAGLIVGWFLAIGQDDQPSEIVDNALSQSEPAQNTAITQAIVPNAAGVADDYLDASTIEEQSDTIKQFEQSLQSDSVEAVALYQQEVRSGSRLTERMRSRMIARIIRFIRLNQHDDAQDLLSAYLTSNAYDAEVLLLQAQLYNIVGQYLEALANAYDAKIYSAPGVDVAMIERLINEILEEYEEQLIEKKEWPRLVSLYNLVIAKDLGERQAAYYYKLAHAQFKLGDYYVALASLSQIIGHPLLGRKAQYFERTIEKFIEGDGVVAIGVRHSDPHKFLVTATINGDIEAELLVDTGASLSVLREKFVAERGLSTEDEKPLTLTTVSDTLEARTIALESFGIDEVSFADMPVGVTEMPEEFLPDGLLGMDFLSQFEFNLDQENLVLYLYSL